MFYLPRRLWKACEGGLMASFGMELMRTADLPSWLFWEDTYLWNESIYEPESEINYIYIYIYDRKRLSRVNLIGGRGFKLILPKHFFFFFKVWQQLSFVRIWFFELVTFKKKKILSFFTSAFFLLQFVFLGSGANWVLSRLEFEFCCNFSFWVLLQFEFGCYLSF